MILLRDVFPCFPEKDLPYVLPGDALEFTYFPVGQYTFCAQGTNLYDFCFNQFCVTIVFSYSRPTPAFAMPVLIVISPRTKPEMVGSDTRFFVPVGTIVENAHAIRDRAVMDFPRQAMDQSLSVIVPNLPVSVGILSACPQPAGKQVLNHNDLFPKTLRERASSLMSTDVQIWLTLYFSQSALIPIIAISYLPTATETIAIAGFVNGVIGSIIVHTDAFLQKVLVIAADVTSIVRLFYCPLSIALLCLEDN